MIINALVSGPVLAGLASAVALVNLAVATWVFQPVWAARNRSKDSQKTYAFKSYPM